MIKKRQFLVRNLFFYGALLKGSVPISCVLGSWHAYFGLHSIIAPLSGVYIQGVSYYLMWLTMFMTRMVLVGASPLSCLAFVIPGFCASFYYVYPSKIIRISLAVLCMILFWLHPVGSVAFPYAFYWFIPIVVNLSLNNHLLAHAIGSTFTAHAVGSVIWLYTTNTTPEQWFSLIPIVAYERILMAGGIYGVQCIVANILRYSKIVLSRLVPTT